jgi:6-phosphogluconolactonase
LPGNHGAGLIRVYPDLESLSRAAAAWFTGQAAQAVKARGRFSVALSGGHTPRRTYELLAMPPYRHEVDWGRVHVFWGDERCVPWDDPRSNARLAYRAWLRQVPLPGNQIHPLDCAQAPEAAARRYEALLREFFGGGPPCLDLVFLGLGENGHTASLFPHTPVLQERERWTAAVQVAGQDLYRVTLTAPLLNRAAAVLFLVAGASKAGVLKEVLRGAYEPERLPAQLIRPESGELLWLVDEAAAAQLTER